LSSHEFLWRSNPQIPIVGNFAGSATRSRAQISLGVSLQTPGDASKQEALFEDFDS